MNYYDIMFYIFAAITLVSAWFVVTTRNVIYSAFFLLFTFFGVAGIYVLLAADFIAVVQIMVYVGGILILLLFGVMLTNTITNVDIRTGASNLLPASIATGILMGAVVSVMWYTEWKIQPTAAPNTTIKELGRLLLTDYVLVFELLGLLLLVALIGAASIARREKE
ncbi:MAG: NADH-quinone oxidoreductase subunit J [Stygiobacter sp. RIFOXYC12_FULL_38_8]|nr:MAG: NADH-quinone oxidoreductase subunit J [Stygiobacter sp. RIFOXYA12_FULL_38_9]OGV06304.1 MAG: NADH-quinone oxidoreductase subunit J [Stygiobacter sp. RIFOXYB2_FULL_37_11]OGV11086.1 MAG: NADH-quinone oxidoreductase subunit J [Stygiobacter sp. RIFOXYA2_FULL_38_8]OGV16054.1 MAG: NADH-quinone oxidoreductase subunit J [Stygiobacter sp. RIFOXYC2_FULL_38_25]OGV25960.1 MAG: NADH-quinone oxidoreductase subunit J [Stygiobacter sp. RIFOXYC12_FULL_38_8]OGV80531.1 MAG: NADH-quinone oxidoreductase sub